MKQQYRHYMQEAIDLAKSSTMEMKHGCVIVNEKAKDRPIVARGINQHIFNMEDRLVFSRHAEMSAVSSLIAIKGHNNNFFENCIAFVARVGPASSNHQVRMSKPCKDCQKLLQKIGINKVFYTYDNSTVCSLTKWDYNDNVCEC